MGFRIEDGLGRGKFASVNAENHLEVASVTLPKIASVSHDGQAFSIIGRHTFQSTGATENIAFVQNNNSNKHVHLSSVTIAVKTSTGVLFTLSFGPTRTSGGTLKTPVQLNRGKAAASGVVVYDNSANNLVLGVTALEDFSEARFGMTMSAQLQGQDAVILGPGDTLCARGSGTAGDLITAHAFMYELELETA
jgi:hypothetical protein